MITTAALPVVTGFVAVIGGVVWSQAGYENLKHQFTEDERAQRIEENVSAIYEDNTAIQSTLKLLESCNDKLLAVGKRDDVLVALINQYQQLSRASGLFGQMSHIDPSQDQGKVAAEIMKILNQDLVHALVRDDLPGKPLVIEVVPNSFGVINPVPMLTKFDFHGLAERRLGCGVGRIRD